MNHQAHRFRILASWLAMAALALLAGGCTTAELALNAAKRAKPDSEAPRGTFKIGNAYQVDGQWYYPAIDLAYHERGVASWYGPNFDGRPTANGEIFDMREVSAAHKTLPLPSVVRVTNLENGRSLVIRINDRGPFVRGRIIDLSQRAAELLGFSSQGTAMVDVRLLPDASRKAALQAGATEADMLAFGPPPPEAAPSIPVTVETLEPLEGVAVAPAPTPASGAPPPYGGMTARYTQSASASPSTASDAPVAVTEIAVAAPTDTREIADPSDSSEPRVVVVPVDAQPAIFIQAGAFTRFDNANRLRARLTPLGHPVRVTQVYITNQPFFRVRLGPLASVEAADRALDRVTSLGYPEARIIIE